MVDSEKIEALVKQFSEGVVKHRENMFSDHVAANRFYDRYVAALKELDSFGEAGFSALARLLEDPRPMVRVSAAIYLISIFPERAIKALETERAGGGVMSPEAVVTLERWKRGMFLDPTMGKEVRKSEKAHLS